MNIFKCDICGAEIIREPFNRFNIQREERSWAGELISLQIDVCDKCFREKLAEVLNIPKDCRYFGSLDKAMKEGGA